MRVSDHDWISTPSELPPTVRASWLEPKFRPSTVMVDPNAASEVEIDVMAGSGPGLNPGPDSERLSAATGGPESRWEMMRPVSFWASVGTVKVPE